MKQFTYLHFSDLHIRQKDVNQYLSNAKDVVLMDLNYMLDELKDGEE